MQTHRNTRRRPLAVAAATTLALGLGAVAAPAASGATSTSANTPTSPTAAIVNATLTITGTKQADVVTVFLSPTDPTSVVVDFGGDATLDQTFPLAAFDTVDANLGAGDDQFTEDLSLLVPAVVEGGTGNDTINTSRGNDIVSGDAGNDTINTSDGDDLIFGGAGSDTVNPGRGNDSVSLDAGQDSVVWNPGDGSDNIDGGTGRDTLVFEGSNAAEIMHLFADSKHVVFTRDVGAITMDMVDVETFDLATLGSADTVTVDDLAGTALTRANIDLSSFGTGDGATDTVIVNALAATDHPRIHQDATGVTVTGVQPVTHVSGGEPADGLQVNTSAGPGPAQPMGGATTR
jgi:Ca2+-binding RTX toxin-like protein